VSLNHFVNDGSTYLISTLFPVVVSVFAFPNFEVGILVAVGYLTNMIFQPLTGRYSERLEARKLLAIGISIVSGSMVLFVFSSNFPAMLSTIVILRIGSSFFHPVGVSTVSRTYSGANLDRAMGFQSAFGNLGVLSVFLLSAPLYALLGWRGPFVVFALFDFAVVAITLLIMSKRAQGFLSSQQEARSQADTAKTPQFRMGLPAYFIITMLISGGAYAAFANFGNLLLANNFSLAESDSLMAVWVLAAFFGAIFTGQLTKRFGRKGLLTLCYFLASVTTLLFALFSDRGGFVLLMLLASGFALSATYPIIYSQLSSFLGEKSTRKGTSYGILFSAQIIGSSLLGLFGGYLATSLGWSFPFEVTSGLLLVGGVVSVIRVEKNQFPHA
jgi:MFS transporter, FSR family, fosmidomycin resistance protein